MGSCFGKDDCKCRHIDGIKCSVEGCCFNDCDSHCTATEISVGTQNAESSGETQCTTFKPREY